MLRSGRSARYIGPVMLLLSAVVWSFSGVLSKGLLWNGFSKAGARSIVAIAIYGIARRSFKVRVTKQLALGAAGVALTSLLYMLALSYTSSANAIVLQYSMPVFVVFLNWLLFRQRPQRRDLFAVCMVTVGVVLCCVQGMSGGALKGDLIALCSGLTFAVVFLASRFEGNDPVSYTYLGNCFSLLMAVSLFFDPNVHFYASGDITGRMVFMEWFTVLLMGLSLGFGYLLFSYGMRSTSPVTAAILSNVEPVLNPVWVFWFLGENPGILSIIGAVVVLATVTLYTCLPRRRARISEGT